VPTAIKRALIARDKSCAFPGCHHFGSHAGAFIQSGSQVVF
jgi:hypothetical protein